MFILPSGSFILNLLHQNTGKNNIGLKVAKPPIYKKSNLASTFYYYALITSRGTKRD